MLFSGVLLLILLVVRLGHLTLNFYHQFVIADVDETSRTYNTTARLVSLKIMVTIEILCAKVLSRFDHQQIELAFFHLKHTGRSKSDSSSSAFW